MTTAPGPTSTIHACRHTARAAIPKGERGASDVRAPARRPAVSGDGWSRLFASAFQRSRNAMLLTDGHRRILDVNGAGMTLLGARREDVIGRPVWTLVVGGPLLSRASWASSLASGRFDGEAQVRRGDDSIIAVQWAASAEPVGGGHRVLVVVLSASRWGSRFRRTVTGADAPRTLSRREREVVHLVALGAPGPEIADELGISHETVRTHVSNAMEKLGARSRAHLVARALAEGHLAD
jgi:PAS domain S-box-containing protein